MHQIICDMTGVRKSMFVHFEVLNEKKIGEWIVSRTNRTEHTDISSCNNYNIQISFMH